MALETPTKIGLISNALILCGENPASSLTENRYGVTVLGNLFEQIYENELCSNRWRFAMTKETLAQLVDAPLNEWAHAYQLPATMLLPIHVFPPTPYEIYADHLYTNASAVDLDYLFKPDISELPAYFAMLMHFALAREAIKSLSESDSGVEVFERKYVAQRARALFADSQGRPNKAIVHSPFTSGVGRVHTQG